MTAEIRKRYIGLEEVEEITSLKKSTIYRLMETGGFPLQAKLSERFSKDKSKVSKVHTKTMSDAKKMALKISKVGGGGDFPIKIEQGPDLVKDKKKFSSGGIVNFKGIF